MKSIWMSSVLLTMGISLSSGAGANLIINGGFENPNVNDNTWRWFHAKDVEGWNGSSIEIWENFLGVDATEGLQFAELNAHGNKGKAFTIYQTFETEINSTYDFSFDYRARRNNLEAFSLNFLSNSVSIYDTLLDDHKVGTWSSFSDSFTAVDTLTTIQFTSITPSTATVGNFLDNIVVTSTTALRKTAISEPSMLMLFGFTGLLLIGITVQRSRHATSVKIE